MDRMKRNALGYCSAMLATGLLWGATGCGRPSGSFVPYVVAITEARPADIKTAVPLMEGVARTAGFQIEPPQTLPAGAMFHASHDGLQLVMGAQVVAGRLHVHVVAMAPRLNQSSAHRKVLADLDNALRRAFGDRLISES
jgi:hypothetical protein